MLNIVDDFRRTLYQLGWNSAASLNYDGEQYVWVVTANKNEHPILTRALSKENAWSAAVLMALKLNC